MPKGIYAVPGSTTTYNDPISKIIKELGLIKMETMRPDSVGYVAQADGTWSISDEVTQALYEADLAKYVDPENLHVSKHELLGETEEAAEALLMFKIAKAKVDEKYNRGATVYVTDSGECYHNTADCSALSTSTTITKINLSEGLEDFSPCSICCN